MHFFVILLLKSNETVMNSNEGNKNLKKNTKFFFNVFFPYMET